MMSSLASPRSAGRLVLIATWVAKKEYVNEVASFLTKMRDNTRREPGCLQYDAVQDKEDETKFVLFEMYTDEKALEAHTSSSYFKKNVLEGAVPLLESRDRKFYTSLF